MPRPPNPKAKIPQLIIRAENEDERMVINGVKHVCALDGLEYKKELLELCRVFLHKHNYPPGNPQRQLFSVKADHECYCGEKAGYEAYSLEGEKFFLCEAHFNQNRDARLLNMKRTKRLTVL
jgi:hypothetical protein